jgi:hypothetical protein
MHKRKAGKSSSRPHQPAAALDRPYRRLTPEEKDRVLEQVKLSLQDRHFAIVPAHDDMAPLKSRLVN